MPNSPFTRLVIFNIFCQVLRSAHHSSGDTSPTSCPLDHFCSLSVKVNWYCPIRFVWHRKVYGPVLHWTDVTEWILHNWGSFDAATNRANHQRPSETKVYHHLILLHFRVCHCIGTARSNLISSTTREQDEEILLRPFIQEVATFCLQQSCSAQILLELYQQFAWSCKGEDFQLSNSAQHAYLLHISSLSLKVDAVNSMKLLYQLKWSQVRLLN